ncbi:hypothetical protein GCM10010440_43470 [Kitasatospora cinereorecta]
MGGAALLERLDGAPDYLLGGQVLHAVGAAARGGRGAADGCAPGRGGVGRRAVAATARQGRQDGADQCGDDQLPALHEPSSVPPAPVPVSVGGTGTGRTRRNYLLRAEVTR